MRIVHSRCQISNYQNPDDTLKEVCGAHLIVVFFEENRGG